MRRLNGEDSAFLSIERPTQPMTSHFVALLRPARAPDGTPVPVTPAYLSDHVARRLGEIPVLRWRVLAVPLGLHHEVAVEDPDFVLDRHLHHVVLPAPGGPAELARLSDTQASRRLDRSRPLWEITLVDGLADGRQALIIRWHHALMDGGPTMLTLTRLLSGEDHVPARPPEPWSPEVIPTRRALLAQAARDLGPSARPLPRLVADTWRGVKAQREFQNSSPVHFPMNDRETPACSLNDAFTARRRHANLTLPLDDIMAVKRAGGVTVTVVVLAVVAGGLRRYLLAQGDLPDRPLISGIPMAFGRPGDRREFGNHFINFTTSLATDVEDPWERMAQISAVTAAARQSMEAFGAENLCAWADEVPPFFSRFLLRRQLRLRQMDRRRADINCNVSVVRGPDAPWTLGAAAVEELYMEGPPNMGCGLSITAFDYDGRMSVGIHTAADAVPDPEVLAQGCVDALAELVRLAAARAPRDSLAS